MNIKDLLTIITGKKEKKGTWLKDKLQNHVELTYHCSECGFEAWGKYELTKYCGGCGARMKKTDI